MKNKLFENWWFAEGIFNNYLKYFAESIWEDAAKAERQRLAKEFNSWDMDMRISPQDFAWELERME